ncbi:hypothetical protein [Microbulbifer marinus]|uniref:Uncharacterized protein n=1 Tax=Microbulbifer marinus TaxID=658218 RepID=A0A1H3VZS4_9GAMM|nr:hypothetical protein [Microbulbifer marinus]SDZ80323.1 hypothetical protein SAMN05216562_0431 [Microbulbifer marinus]
MSRPKNPKFSAYYIVGKAFSLLFLSMCVAILISTVFTFGEFIFSTAFFYREHEIPQLVINAISNLIIALAMFELFLVIDVDEHPRSRHQTMHVLLNSAPRFIIVVCVALALEGLVLVIKFSQDANKEELIYPMVVVVSSAILLIGLGIFLKICPRPPQDESLAPPTDQFPESSD